MQPEAAPTRPELEEAWTLRTIAPWLLLGLGMASLLALRLGSTCEAARAVCTF